jgi:hypothetical protein
MLQGSTLRLLYAPLCADSMLSQGCDAMRHIVCGDTASSCRAGVRPASVHCNHDAAVHPHTRCGPDTHRSLVSLFLWECISPVMRCSHQHTAAAPRRLRQLARVRARWAARGAREGLQLVCSHSAPIGSALAGFGSLEAPGSLAGPELPPSTASAAHHQHTPPHPG